MRPTALRSGLVSLVLVILLATTAGSIAAHDDACELKLRQAPIEDIPPLPGWTWREVDLSAHGWHGSLEWAGGDLRKATFEIACVVDPAGLFERRAELRASVWDEQIEIDGVIGEESMAWRSSRTATTHLLWRGGGTLGEVVGEWNTSVAELAATAGALEEALASSGAPPQAGP